MSSENSIDDSDTNRNIVGSNLHTDIHISLVIANISKSPNVRSLLLAAAAFGCHSILVVGQESIVGVAPGTDRGTTTIAKNTATTASTDDPTAGTTPTSIIMDEANIMFKEPTTTTTTTVAQSQPQSSSLPPAIQRQLENDKVILQRFHKWKDCSQYINDNDICLIGVEIDDASVVLDFSNGCFSRIIENFLVQRKQQQHIQHKQPRKSLPGLQIAILMGNEGQGIHPKHMRSCHGFVRIPQYGVGTASLNVSVAASIVLYRFHEWIRSRSRLRSTQPSSQEEDDDER